MSTQVDEQSVGAGAGETVTATLSWSTSASDPDETGAYEATAASDNDADAQLFTVGSRDLGRSLTGFTPGGAGAVSRTGAAARSLTGTTPGGAGTATRTATASRSVTATGTGAGSVAWTSASAWALETAAGSGRRVLLTPESIETDHDQLSLTAQFASTVVDEDLDRYRRAGDVDRETTAFGAYRRIPRDGRDPVTIRPPTDSRPPFDERRAVPTDFQAEEIAPYRQQVELTLGLEEPRPREPLEGDDESLRVDEQLVTADAVETTSTTLRWTPDGSQLGDWLMTASTESDSDSTLISASDAPWTLSWPVATLSLTERQVAPIERGADESAPTVGLSLRIDAEQAAVLVATGSRVEAAEVRFVPDAGNTVVDTLPNDELTCNLSTPDDSDVDDGTFVLRSWELSRERPAPPAYDATVTLVRSD